MNKRALTWTCTVSQYYYCVIDIISFQHFDTVSWAQEGHPANEKPVLDMPELCFLRHQA